MMNLINGLWKIAKNKTKIKKSQKLIVNLFTYNRLTIKRFNNSFKNFIMILLNSY